MSKKIAVIWQIRQLSCREGADVQRGFGGDTLNTSVYIARQVDSAALAVHLCDGAGYWRFQPADAGGVAA